MPSISLFDSWGTMHHITSSNPQTISAWLLERLELCSDGTTLSAPVRMEVYPQEIRGELDWPTKPDTRSMAIGPDDVKALSLVLEWIAAGRSSDHQKLADLFHGLSETVGV